MKNIHVIKTEEEYKNALARIEKLMEISNPTQAQEDDLELLGVLVADYEDKHYPIDLPDPIEAIKFRMDQEGLTRKDLIKYIGSASKVSEVLNHKLPLSLSMMRALNEGLGIPAEVLLQKPGNELPPCVHTIDKYPFNEMFKLDYFAYFFTGTLNEAKTRAEELLEHFFAHFTRGEQIFCKKTEHVDFSADALSAWKCHIHHLLDSKELTKFSRDALDDKFFDRVARLSFYSEGPKLVEELLNSYGIHFVIQKHLSRTYLDGAAFMLPNGAPVVALTLRYDRVDNFWFTLLHELAHLKYHVSDASIGYFDDFDGQTRHSENANEQQANHQAEEALIPDEVWQKEKKALLHGRDIAKLEKFARNYLVAPAVVAGRIRWEKQNFTLYTECLGHVKDMFR
ncbi:MAG: ImmA/IrrE family metallo-endopeptidase [Victivallales bacterium]|nr:ImmA/IrrE family metallo-endopeptidase [Victivallales bacterium]